MTRVRRRGMPTFQFRLAALAVASCFTSSAHANPSGASVVAGSATFDSLGNALNITSTPGAIIQWQNFSIRADEITRFLQQNAASTVLNRVVGSDVSSILGQLLSNGKVFLLNPNGIFIGGGAVIDTAGFVASSLRLSDADFLAGKFKFDEQVGAGRIVNQGTINANGGPVYLVAPNVENHGVITSPTGEVILAAGKTVELVAPGTPHVRVELNAPENEAVNVGKIVAEAGSVGIFGTTIRHSGAISANSASIDSQGRVVFRAKRDVTIDAGATVTANGPGGGAVTLQAEGGTLLDFGAIEARGTQARGGTVQLLGDRVGLAGQASVIASGQGGGGTVLIGGDFHGGNDQVQNASRTYVGKDVTISADAIGAGSGGKVVIWSDDTTRFYGTINARGGAVAGDGGAVEVSGKKNLLFDGAVFTTAPHGSAGSLLLDPADIVIADAASSADDAQLNADIPTAGDAAGVVNFSDSAGTTFTISSAKLESTASTNNIDLQSTNSIVINDLVTNVATSKTLTLNSPNSVKFQTGAGGFSMATDNKIKLTNAAGASLLIDAKAGTGSGNVTVGALETKGSTGSITLKGVTANLFGNLTTDGGKVDFTGSSKVSLNANVTIDTASTAATAGDVDFGNAALTAAAAGKRLTIDTSSNDNAGGTVSLGPVDNSGGSYVNQLTVKLFDTADTNSNQTAGKLKLTGDVRLDNDGAGTAAKFLVTGGVADTTATSRRGQVIVAPATGSSVSISTVQSAAKAGDVDLGTTQLTAATAGRDLTINTSSSSATGGNITLGTTTNVAGQYLGALTLNALGSSSASDGVIKLNSSIQVDPQSARDAITIKSTDVRLNVSANTQFTFDTNVTAGNQAGNVNLSQATISGVNSGITVTIDTSSSTDGRAGGIELGGFSNAGGQYINAITATATDGTGTGGTVGLNRDVKLDFATSAGSLVVDNGNASIIVRSTLSLDTEQGNTDSGGQVLLGTSSLTSAGAPISAASSGLTLTIDTSSTQGGKAGGAISLGAFGNSGGGQYLGALVVDATGPGGDGTVRLNNSISVDPNAVGDAITLRSGDVRLMPTGTSSFVFDTNAGSATQAGNVNLSSATLSAGGATVDFTIDTSSTTSGSGGNVQIGKLLSTGGGNDFRSVKVLAGLGGNVTAGQIGSTRISDLTVDGGNNVTFNGAVKAASLTVMNVKGTISSGAAIDTNGINGSGYGVSLSTTGLVSLAGGATSASKPILLSGTDWSISNAQIDAGSSTIELTRSQAGTIQLGGEITTSELSLLTTSNQLTIGGGTSGENINVAANASFAATTPNVKLRTDGSGSSITDTSGSVVGQPAGTLTLTSAAGIGSADLPIKLSGGSGSIVASNSTSGIIDLATINTLKVGTAGIINNAGSVTLVSGSTSGMTNASQGYDAVVTAGSGGGGIDIQGPVRSFGGKAHDITLYSAGAITQPTGSTAGLQAGPSFGGVADGKLNVRTFNDTAQAAKITLENNLGSGAGGCSFTGTGNCMGPITLETRYANGFVGGGQTYQASDISYKSINGTNISGIGTAADLAFVAPSVTVSLAQGSTLSAKNLSFVATAGDVTLDNQITNDQINGGQAGGTLSFKASGSVNLSSPKDGNSQGVSIGKRLGFAEDGTSIVEAFNHELTIVAQGDINISGSIYMAGDLKLRANASSGELNGGPLAAGAGNGSVNLSLMPSSFYKTAQPATPFPLEIKAKNVIIGGKDSVTGEVYGVKNLSLDASATMDTQQAFAQPGKSQRSDVIIESTGTLEAYLLGDLTMKAGLSRATTSGSGQVLKNTAIAAMVGNDITIRGVKDAGGNNSTNISLFGGDAASDARAGGGAIASSDAFMVAKNTKSIDIGGTLLLRGGKTALTGQSTAVAKLDPSVLTISTGGDIILIGGEGPNSSASIVNNGDIQLVIGGNGYRTITYSALKDLSTFETKTVTVPGGLIIIGGPGSGLFGARSTQIELGDQIKAAFTRGGGYTLSIDTGLPSAFIEANSLRAFDSLLGYIIFAANEETRAARIRAGLGASDDSNMPACN